jgi:hypothetical protein
MGGPPCSSLKEGEVSEDGSHRRDSEGLVLVLTLGTVDQYAQLMWVHTVLCILTFKDGGGVAEDSLERLKVFFEDGLASLHSLQ